MTNESIYDVWRPVDSPWARWVKPVVFPFLRPVDHGAGKYSVQDWQVTFQSDTAIIADLRGAEGISAGIALARAGYLPVLVYNACPTGTSDNVRPEIVSAQNSGAIIPPAVVDMTSILAALCATTQDLVSLNLASQAPPVFLLDANRRGLGIPYGPGWFDNRSFVTPADFPSAEYFQSHGISRVILVQATRDINVDLSQVLLGLQSHRMTIATQAPWQPWSPRPIVVKPPNLIVSIWEWLRQKLGYHRDPFSGSFGGVVPHSSG
jgi:hypothetical protein